LATLSTLQPKHHLEIQFVTTKKPGKMSISWNKVKSYGKKFPGIFLLFLRRLDAPLLLESISNYVCTYICTDLPTWRDFGK
jgi:hypothetical protein